MSDKMRGIPGGPILNAYPDSLGGTLKDIADFLELPELEQAFSSLYILPSLFNSDLDRGFSVIDYQLNAQLASPDDLKRIREKKVKLILDFVINHASAACAQFRDILAKGDSSIFRDFFIDWNKFWAGHGEMTAEGYVMPEPSAMQNMCLRKPGLPLLMVRMPGGRPLPYWNTFYQEIRYPCADALNLAGKLHLPMDGAACLAGIINRALDEGRKPGEIDFGLYGEYRQSVVDMLESNCSYHGQMDLNIHSPLVWEHYRATLKTLAGYGAAIVRLDAFAYASKEPGARNFLNEPGTWDLLRDIRSIADTDALTLLPEIHASYADHICDRLSGGGYLCYDFFLPGLILDALENASGEYLLRWARELQEKKIASVNMLGCHDGIPLLDLKGLLPDERIEALIRLVTARGGLVKNLHGSREVYYQVNAAYFSALGLDGRKLLLSRALQLFMPGIPQIWYLDLFAGENDLDAVARAGSSGHKEINRTNLTRQEVRQGLEQDLVRDQINLIRFRNTCGAFGLNAIFQAQEPKPGTLRFSWHCQGCAAYLEADLKTCSFTVRGVDAAGGTAFMFVQS